MGLWNTDLFKVLILQKNGGKQNIEKKKQSNNKNMKMIGKKTKGEKYDKNLPLI